MRITITGSVPSKKNSKSFFVRDGKPMIVPGKVHRNWHKQASMQLYGVKSITDIRSVAIIIYAADMRRGDLTNKAESIMDLLVDNRIIEDDNWFICPSLVLQFGGVDRKNPRAEIIIN